MKRWKAVPTPLSENERSRYKRLNPAYLGYVENRKIKWHKRWKLQCPTCVPKNTLIYKIIISPQDASAQQMAQHKPKTNPNRTMLHTCFHTCFTHTLVLKHQQDEVYASSVNLATTSIHKKLQAPWGQAPTKERKKLEACNAIMKEVTSNSSTY